MLAAGWLSAGRVMVSRGQPWRSTTGSASATVIGAAQLLGQRGDAGVGDATRHDPVEPAEVRIAVQRKAVQRHALGDPDPDRGDLAFRAAVVGRQPDPAASLDLAGGQAEVGADLDQHPLQPADVGHHVDRVGQLQDRIADQLAGSMPGDLAAAVDVDHRRAVARALPGLGAPAGGVDRRVFQQQRGVLDLAGHPLRVQLALPLPGLVVVDAGRPGSSSARSRIHNIRTLSAPVGRRRI